MRRGDGRRGSGRSRPRLRRGGIEGIGGGMLVLEDTGLMTHDDDPGGKTFVDAHNGFNDLIQLAMLWTMWHCWPAGVRFAFN